jgi:hypothetical protein
MSVFLNVNSKYLADIIHSACSRVLYAAPGLDEVIASALINISKKIGKDNVTILLDVSESVLHYGYGNIDGITLLKENAISIKESVGLRIGALICDDEGVVFTPTPLLIEAGKNDSTQPNAIKAAPKQVEDIIYAVIPPKEPQNRDERKLVPEIGKTLVSSKKIEKVENLINKNPPQKFDVARRVQVFSTAIEFVEIKLKGCEIQRHTVSIPAYLLVGKADSATKKQLRAGFNIIEKGSLLSGDSIRGKVNELKKSFTKPIPKYGSVLLKSKKEKFNDAIKELKQDVVKFQKEVEKDLDGEIKKARNRLIKLLIPAIKENPPDDLSCQIQGEKATEEQVEKYLELKLDGIFPSSKDITKEMSLDCIIKAVTYETISNKDFQNKIKAAYPLINWDEMFEEYDAARESN